jgi:ribosomal protein S18 acetylase RimI-like enzyme
MKGNYWSSYLRKLEMASESSQVIIREVNEDDLSALEWEGEYSHFRLIYQRAMLESRKGRQILLVAEANNRIVGQLFIQLNSVRADPKPQPYTAYLYSFRVRPGLRNKGIGSALIKYAEETLRELAYRRALIAAAKTNPGARRLYERHGYAVIAEDAGAWSFVDDLNRIHQITEPSYIMEKWLK